MSVPVLFMLLFRATVVTILMIPVLVLFRVTVMVVLVVPMLVVR